MRVFLPPLPPLKKTTETAPAPHRYPNARHACGCAFSADDDTVTPSLETILRAHTKSTYIATEEEMEEEADALRDLQTAERSKRAERINAAKAEYNRKKVKKPLRLSSADRRTYAAYDDLVLEGGNLDSWVEQGVFLFNTALTTLEGVSANDHLEAWKPFAVKVMEALLKADSPVAILCWGRDAREVYYNGKDIVGDAKAAKHSVCIAGHPSPRAGNLFMQQAPFALYAASAFAEAYGHKPIDWNIRRAVRGKKRDKAAFGEEGDARFEEDRLF